MNNKPILLLFFTGFHAVFSLTGCTLERNFEDEQQESTSLIQFPGIQANVPYVPTPQAVVDSMLKLSEVNHNDIVYDLGSGDGRIPITAVQKYNARRAVGVEINPRLIQTSRSNAQKAGVSERVDFQQQNLFETDFKQATVVTLYLLPDVNLKLRPNAHKGEREKVKGKRVFMSRFPLYPLPFSPLLQKV